MTTNFAAAVAAVALTMLGAASAEVTGRGNSYDKVLIDEIELAYDAASPLQSLSRAEAKRIGDAARAALTSAAAGRFTIVEQPGPGVLRLHASIIGIDAAKKDKHFWRFTPVGAIKTGVDAASGSDFVVRAATVEVSMLDAVSGEPLPGSLDAAGDDTSAPTVAASLRELTGTLEQQARRRLALVATP
jgi:uncharacterized protein DUF3313